MDNEREVTYHEFCAMHGHVIASDGRLRIFVQKVDPQPANLPDGLVLVYLPSNCYVKVGGE